MVMDRVCRDDVVGRPVEKMWKKRFMSSVSTPTGLDLCWPQFVLLGDQETL